jgi:hypothetical protein
MTVLKDLAKITTSKINFNQIIIERILKIIGELINFKSHFNLIKNENIIELIVIYAENKSVMQIEDFYEQISGF